MPLYSTCAILPEPGTVRMESFELPPLAHDEVLVKTTKTLISPGTERALLLNLPGLNVQYPKSVGYCHVGNVTEVGSEVTGLALGERVASKSRHAGHVIVKASLCHKVDDSLDDESATFFQLLATALQGVRKTRLEVGEATVIVGAGLVGLLALQVARAAGALPIAAIDAHEGRLNLARQLGADHCLLAKNAVTKLLGMNGSADGLPVVIEATGNPSALESACRIAEAGGRIALLGSSRGTTAGFDFYKQVHKRGITLIGAHISTGNRPASAPGWWTLFDEQRTALKLLAHGRVAIQPLITHRFCYSNIDDAYDLLAQWNLDSSGIVIDWT